MSKSYMDKQTRKLGGSLGVNQLLATIVVVVIWVLSQCPQVALPGSGDGIDQVSHKSYMKRYNSSVPKKHYCMKSYWNNSSCWNRCFPLIHMRRLSGGQVFLHQEVWSKVPFGAAALPLEWVHVRSDKQVQATANSHMAPCLSMALVLLFLLILSPLRT